MPVMKQRVFSFRKQHFQIPQNMLTSTKSYCNLQVFEIQDVRLGVNFTNVL